MPPDSSQLVAVLDRYERPLVRYALSILHDVEAARDVVQETFVQYAEGRGPAASPEENPRGSNNGNTPLGRHAEAWLFTVTRNRAIDHQRKQSRIIPMHPIDDRSSDEPGPAAVLERREIAGSLLRLLDELSANQREVIRLKFQNDLSYKEIAEITQLSVTNVGFLLHTGLKKLRALVLAQPHDDFPVPARQAL
jgi:RNA polymerase sigma-70 factor (ECF subfamily)